MSKLQKIMLSVAVVLSAVSLVLVSRQPSFRAGSVSIANEYHSTSTSASMVDPTVIKTGNGALGSVIITTTGTATMCFYDGTSTVTNSEWATSTLACFNASPTVGTYTFDTIFQKGLILDFGSSGSRATTTVTYR